MSQETAVAVAGQTALAAFDGIEDDGFENVEDVNVRAFINLANHPNHLEWTEGIKLGQIYNTLTDEVYDELLFIPCAVDKYVAEYTDDNEFVKQHAYDSEEYQSALANALDKKTKRIDYKNIRNKNGNKLQASHDVYALVSPDNGETWMFAIMPMSSTKIKPYERFFKTLKLRKTRLFENICHLGTKETTKGSNKYYNYTYKHISILDDEFLAEQVVACLAFAKENIAYNHEKTLQED
jgi:hypothetical protein